MIYYIHRFESFAGWLPNISINLCRKRNCFNNPFTCERFKYQLKVTLCHLIELGIGEIVYYSMYASMEADNISVNRTEYACSNDDLLQLGLCVLIKTFNFP